MGFHGLDKLTAVFRRHRFVIDGMREKRGRSFGGDLLFVGIEADELGLWIRAKKFRPGAGVRIFSHRNNGIDEPGEIGSATESLDGIGRIGIAAIEVRCGSGSNVASSGEAENPNPLRINLPRSGVRAGEADGALGVE